MMLKMQLLFSILILLFLMQPVPSSQQNVQTSGKLFVCYYTPVSYFPADKVPANLCTHIVYAFAQATPDGIKPMSSRDVNSYRKLIQLKEKNPNLKILLSLQKGFSSVVSTDTAAMKRFATEAVKFLASFCFDGLDLDWEFPKATDKKNFAQFIEILQAQTSGAHLSLSAALPNTLNQFKGYDVDCLAKYLDFMTAMTYDFHLYIEDIDNITGYSSPLYSPKGESKIYSTSGVIDFYLTSGIPSNKLLMGIPAYGRSWTLADASNHGLHAPATGRGDPSPKRHLRGVYSYPDVCDAKSLGAKYVNDDQNGAAYLYWNKTWVTYDGKHTLNIKLPWMKQQNLGGVGVWAMHLDDTDGVCGSGFLPFLNAIKSQL